ncbi:MAG TPA: GntR family transcriptional regulator [Candidatus Limiplasma sp.]|nr:GntR family transcriptional regulator [Candidatus Limiplasma sp.]HPS80449.1 GntR family transcriptional regulator [Candidatus Limiplasma sp.]
MDHQREHFDPLQMSDFQLKDSQTVASQIYKTLRERIINMQLPPGVTMSEQETANALGVSRTPVREAFIRLSREKMVIISPQRRTAVAKISTERAQQEHFLRESLEQAVLEQFVLNLKPEVLTSMTQIIDQQRRAMIEHDFDGSMYYDDEFHKTFYVATDKYLCYQVLRRNCFDYQRLRYLSSCSDEAIQQLNLDQHEQMLRLIAERNLQDVQSLLRRHVRRIFDEMITLKEKYPQYIL